MKRFSALHVMRKLQIRTMRYHYTSITIAEIWIIDNTKCWQESGATGTLHSLLVGMQNGTVILEDSMAVFYKTNRTLTI